MATRAPTSSTAHWLSWVVGTALLATVVAVALRFSEAEAIVRLLQALQAEILLLAIVLQAGTYVAQGAIWRDVATAAGSKLSFGAAIRLSLAKLFIDQALPSAGVSGTVVVGRQLEEQGLARTTVMAAVVVNTASYFVTYVFALSLAVLLIPLHGAVRHLVLLGAAIFALCSIALVVMILALPGRTDGAVARRLAQSGVLKAPLSLLIEADVQLARSPPLLLRACVCQFCIILLDAATVWLLIKALGITASLPGVFASFMISNLFRTIGILPGGLGSFEASSILTLQVVGVPLPVALSATLLFRGLSFWLPMVPGLWCSRQMVKPTLRTVPVQQKYWSTTPEELLLQLQSTAQGLSGEEALRRLRVLGPNKLDDDQSFSGLRILARQLASPLLLLLVFAAAIAAATGEWADAVIVLIILFASVAIGYRREYSAQAAAAALRSRVQVRTKVLRDQHEQMVLLEEIVPGDIVLLAAGSLVPADARVLEAADAHVSESVLTGESFPVEKHPEVLAPETPLSHRSNCVYLGTNVRSGMLRCVVVATGTATQFGSIAQRLSLRPPETEFDRGIRRFGYFLTSAMLTMVLLIFVAHMLAGRPLVDTLLFAVALAVGLSPELLPAILSFNLARGAEVMAQRGVLVRRLNAIENLGSMDILCTDKTGTLTEGVINLEGGYDAAGLTSRSVVELAAINAALETGLASPLDDAILDACKPDLSQVTKLAEIPFDFVRKRVSVVVQRADGAQLISKGAFQPVLDACTQLADGRVLDAPLRRQLQQRYDAWGGNGIRVLALASRTLQRQSAYARADETRLTFEGFLTFTDRPKVGAKQALADLAKMGVSVKLITGDARQVAQHLAGLVGMSSERVLTGAQLDELHDEALWREAERTDLFVEVDPNQKERIILSLKKMGHVVGFLGDGVNDAPAMHAADTSLSVEHAVDVAREAADFVLLQSDLDVIKRGIEAGRMTFANTLKYVLTTTSANLGNMISMAIVSLFLPFLPLLAGQILLNNFLSDIPAIGLANDSVDTELVVRPRRWDMGFIGRFMVEFGLLSSIFDLLTFGALLWLFHASAEPFRTGWFIESLLTELVIALVVRTRRPFFNSRPGTLLLVSTLCLMALTLAIPYLPYISVMGFVPLPPALMATLVAITVLYVLAAELTKVWFYRARS